MSAADARAVSGVRPERAGGWGRKALVPAMLLIVVATGATWLDVIQTIRDPDPLSIPDQPQIAGIVWSNRVFVHERSLKRWLEAHGQSYAVWARKHPRAVAVLRDRPQPALAAPPTKLHRAAGAGRAASDDVGLTALALLITGLLGATALLLVAVRRAVAVVLDRSSRLPQVDIPSLGRRSWTAWQGLARTVQRTVTAARAGTLALTQRLARRWADGMPSAHRRPSAAPPLRARLGGWWSVPRPAPRRSREPRGPGLGTRFQELWLAARPALRRSSEPRGPGLSERLGDWWADFSPGERVRERLDESSATDRMQRLYDGFADALETLRDYRLRVALWVLTAVVAAAGVTFLISQATQP